jgi:membrane protein involved in colicin uptake
MRNEVGIVDSAGVTQQYARIDSVESYARERLRNSRLHQKSSKRQLRLPDRPCQRKPERSD